MLPIRTISWKRILLGHAILPKRIGMKQQTKGTMPGCTYREGEDPVMVKHTTPTTQYERPLSFDMI